VKQFVYIPTPPIFAVLAYNRFELAPPNLAVCDNTNYIFPDVQYIFENTFIGCHLFGEEAMAADDFSFYQGIEVALNADQLIFLSQIRWKMCDSDYNMPPTEKMSNNDIQKLECWIATGYPE
tara:strand:- start:2479 stop:2844 length:366 start_codon:yes stop_codon:yes gene_type:complete